jgi:hypothetical protein
MINKLSVIAVFLPDVLTNTPNRRRPHERPGRNAQTSLLAATYWSVRFTRSPARRCHAGQRPSHSCDCSVKVTRQERRVHTSRYHARYRHNVQTPTYRSQCGPVTGLAPKRNLLRSCLQRQSVYPNTRCRNTEDHIQYLPAFSALEQRFCPIITIPYTVNF